MLLRHYWVGQSTPCPNIECAQHFYFIIAFHRSQEFVHFALKLVRGSWNVLFFRYSVITFYVLHSTCVVLTLDVSNNQISLSLRAFAVLDHCSTPIHNLIQSNIKAHSIVFQLNSLEKYYHPTVSCSVYA